MTAKSVFMAVISLAILVFAMAAADSDASQDYGSESGVSVGDTVVSEGLTFRIVSDDPLSASLTGFETLQEELVVPSEVVFNGVSVPVTEIGTKAFYACKSLTSVDIGDVSSIGMKAFANCSGIKALYMGGSLESVGTYAFCFCSGLADVYMGGSEGTLKAIGSYAFYGCLSMKGFDLGSAQKIGFKAFANCSSLESIDSSASVIGDFAFANCSSLTHASFSASLRQIGDYAFYKTILLDSSGKRAVSAADLRGGSFDGHGGVLRIGGIDATVDGLTYSIASGSKVSVTGYVGSPSAIVLPASIQIGGKEYGVASVQARAFYGCSSLESADLGSAQDIGFKAFANCGKLASVDIRASSIGDYAFANCAGLSYVSFSDVLTSAGRSAFYGIEFLDESGVPAVSAESLAGKIFEGTGRILSSIPSEFTVDGIAYSIVSNGKVSVKGYSGSPYSIIIPSSVSSGGKSYQVVSVGAYAFYGCKSLRMVYITSAQEIGFKAFANCSNLLSATISASSIGDYAFANCVGLAEISFSGSLSSVGNNAFWKATFQDLDGKVIPATADNLAGKIFAGLRGALKERASSQFDVTASISGSGSGAICVNGVDEGQTYSGTFAKGDSITLEAVPGIGCQFDRWVVNGTEFNSSIIIINVSRGFDAIAYMSAAPLRTVSASIEAGTVSFGDGISAKSISGTFRQGETVTVIAEPAYGYYFRGWTNGDDVVSDSETYEFVVTGDADYEAVVGSLIHTLSVTVSHGTLIIDEENVGPSYEVSLCVGESLAVVVVPDVGYMFSGWDINGSKYGPDFQSIVFTMGSDDIRAAAECVSTEGPILHATIVNGSIEFDGVNMGSSIDIAVPCGEEHTLEAVPDSGYRFDHWVFDGSTLSSPGIAFTMGYNDIYATAECAKMEDAILHVTAINGTIEFDGVDMGSSMDIAVPCGEEHTLKAVPDSGYRFDYWVIDGSTLSSPGIVFTMGTQNVSAGAVMFKTEIFHVSISIDNGNFYYGEKKFGSSIVATVESGNSIKILAQPADGYSLVGWFIDGASDPICQENEFDFVPSGDIRLVVKTVPIG